MECAEFSGEIKICQDHKYIKFGGYDWQVLDKRHDRILIISRDIIDICPYDTDFTEEYWQTCTLRSYLNNKFLKKFKPRERARIIKTKIHNDDNPWYKTPGGEDTYDKIFLLSAEEADIYFNTGSDLLTERIKEFDFDRGKFIAVDVDITSESGKGGFFSNEHDINRQANYRGIPAYWWLRTPGVLNNFASFVFDNGGIGVVGLDLAGVLDVGGVGVRPAMWLYDEA
jgi:hypothetical protein